MEELGLLLLGPSVEFPLREELLLLLLRLGVLLLLLVVLLLEVLPEGHAVED